MELHEFEDKYLAHLNEQQKEAVRAVDGPVLLLATPGSGKTTVLVTRLGYMILRCGIDPGAILTMTYTIAATQDMKKRFSDFFGTEIEANLQFRTINGVSAKIIEHASRIHAGRPPFDLITDEGERKRIIRTICQSVNESYPEDSEVKEIRRLITYIKNMMLSDEEIQKLETNIDKLPEIYRQYRDTLRRQRLMDYDDQMAYAYNILQRYPDVLSHFQDQYRYICVDEAQDTSRIQHEIIKLLASKYENLFMVGDEDQSIYGFRAAYPQALLSFETDHPNARVLLMEENYRSSEEIAAAANRFVSNNQFRHKKSIIPTRGSVSPVHVVQARSRSFQFEYLVRMAACCVSKTAILFRNNDTALPLIDLFEKNHVSYNCKSIDDYFFTHRVVIDILDIIRLAADPFNEELFMRLYYKFGAAISRKSAQYAVTKSKSSQKPIFEELMHAPEIRGPVQDAVTDLMQNLSLLSKDNAEAAIHRIWEAMHYGRYVDQRKLDRGKFFILCMLAKGIASPQAFIEKLDWLRSTISARKSSNTGQIILSTIHSSKGLEYDTVYLADVIDGVLPSILPSDIEDAADAKLYEEERRLFYVGMTRAQNDLYLFRCGSEPSCFVSEVARALPVPVIDPDDVFAALSISRVGKHYFDQKYGQGEIAAECEAKSLIVFPDGHIELLSTEEMLSRRSKKMRYALPKSKPASMIDPSLLKDAANGQLLSQLHPGSRILHRSFGPGQVVSIQNDILTVDFALHGRKKLIFTLSIRNRIITAL